MDENGFRDRATNVKAIITNEKNMWVVYLEITFWEWDEDTEPHLNHVRHRIQAYTDKRRAELAAKWMKRAAEKDLKSPPLGF